MASYFLHPGFLWLSPLVALPIIIPRIAWEAHVGGLIAGVIITFAWERLPSRGPGVWMQRAIVALSVATAAVLMLILL